MQFTARSQDGKAEITWTDGKLTGTGRLPEILADEARLREQYGPPVEMPTLHYIDKGILADPLGALGLILETVGPCDITGDVPVYQDDEDSDNTVY